MPFVAIAALFAFLTTGNAAHAAPSACICGTVQGQTGVSLAGATVHLSGPANGHQADRFTKFEPADFAGLLGCWRYRICNQVIRFRS
jgi:hypothetical protein